MARRGEPHRWPSACLPPPLPPPSAPRVLICYKCYRKPYLCLHETLTVGSAQEATPYVSAAELVKKFESGTRKLSITHSRSRSHIAEAPSFPPLPRKTPQVPEFNEFHLKTMERATRYADTCSEVSCAETIRSQNKPLKLTQPKPPQLHTAKRVRPPSVKSSQGLELEELEKAPKFKARPLNKKILESKGDIGVLAHPKSQVTAPKEFHFSTDVRLGPPSVADLFDKHAVVGLPDVGDLEARRGDLGGGDLVGGGMIVVLAADDVVHLGLAAPGTLWQNLRGRVGLGQVFLPLRIEGGGPAAGGEA